MNRPLVVQTEELDDDAAEWLGERCDLVRCGVGEPGFSALLRRASGLLVRTYTNVNSAMLDAAPNLRVVGRAGVGLDRIDVAACRAQHVEVVHTPDANSSAVAEYVFALLLDATRPRVFLDGALDEPAWRQVRGELGAPKQLCQLRLGILGLGRIGRRVATIGTAFGMEVLAHDHRHVAEAARGGARMTPLGALLEQSDVLTIHIDPRPENHGFVGRRVLEALRESVIVINTSRGVIVDHHALADFLRANPGAQALLDVHDPEPIRPDHPLLGVPNAHLSPHIAAATALANANMSWVVRDVWKVLCGETPESAAP